MDNKVSDFKIAASTIKKLCKKHNVVFVDAPISFEDKIENVIFIGETRNVAHTNFKIVAEYIRKSPEINGTQLLPNESEKDNFLIMLATNLRACIYDGNTSNEAMQEAHIMRLYQYPLVWILMKDIICPVYSKNLINIKIMYGGSPQIDIARYYKKGEIFSDISEEPFIFVNRIDNRMVQNAFIFMEALKGYDLSPIEVIKDIYETDLYSKFHGLLEIALYSDDEVDDFECAIMTVLGINIYDLISKKVAKFNPKFVKTSQNYAPGLPNQFWYFGILEKMMEPVRGSNWSVYKNLQPYVEEFWNKVEEIRQKRIKEGHDSGVPFDVLLRLKSKQTVGYETDPTQTLQALLSSDRVW